MLELFKNHILVQENIPCKSWKLRDTTSPFHWYYVIWSAPGIICLAGDCFSLVIEVYQLDTAETAAKWILEADFSYIMRKSNAEKEYCAKRTAEMLIDDVFRSRCDPICHYSNFCDGCKDFDEYIQKINEYTDPFIQPPSWDATKEQMVRNILDKTGGINENEMFELIAHTYSYSDAAEMIRYDYAEITKTQYDALVTWAKLVTKPSAESAEIP